MAAAAILGFLKSRNFIHYSGAELRDASAPNFVKSGQLVAKILKFFDVSRWQQLPSWIFEIVNFYLLPVSAVP